ncbi:MAG: DUF3800 domain-containing protein [Nitrospira sp.]|nr:DUF3800 domain-containing protein [Nitrospira sp.]
MVDVPYFGDSSEVHLLQVADFVAYFLRRHAEITGGYSPERYELEAGRIEGGLRVLRSCGLAPRFITPCHPGGATVQTYFIIMPRIHFATCIGRGLSDRCSKRADYLVLSVCG